MMIETTKLYILISVCMTLTFIQGQGYIYDKSKTLVSIFSQILGWSWMKYSLLPQPVDL